MHRRHPPGPRSGPKSRSALGPNSRSALGPKSRSALGPKSRSALGPKSRSALGPKSRSALGPVLALALLAGCAPGTGAGSTATPASGAAAPVVTTPPAAPVTSAPPPPTPPTTNPAGVPADGEQTGPEDQAEPAPTVSGQPNADPLVAPARAALDSLPVRPPGPMTGYNRKEFGQAWSDDVSVEGGHNGCDTRNDILGRDLTDIRFKPGTRDCVVLSGTLVGPYSGRVVAFVRGARTSTAVQIDHVVALADAWRTGARALAPERRRDLANDPLELLAVDGATNQGKRDSDAAGWLPPRQGFHCSYIARQVLVKQRYGLWATPPEAEAMHRVLDAC